MNSDPCVSHCPHLSGSAEPGQGYSRESCAATETVPSPGTDLLMRFGDTEPAALIFQAEDPHFKPKLGDPESSEWCSFTLRRFVRKRGWQPACLPSLHRHFWGPLCAGQGCSLGQASHFCPQEAEASCMRPPDPLPRQPLPRSPPAARVTTLSVERWLSQMRCLPAKRHCICSS